MTLTLVTVQCFCFSFCSWYCVLLLWYWLRIFYLFSPDIATWCWKMWRRCGQRFPKPAKARRSPSLSTRIASFPKCSWEETRSFLCWRTRWHPQNRIDSLWDSELSSSSLIYIVCFHPSTIFAVVVIDFHCLIYKITWTFMELYSFNVWMLLCCEWKMLHYRRNKPVTGLEM